MPEKVLLSVRLIETDGGYSLEIEEGGQKRQHRRVWQRGCGVGPRQPSKEELREALDSLQDLYDDLYGKV